VEYRWFSVLRALLLGNRHSLKALHEKADRIMKSEQNLQDTLDTIKTETGQIIVVVTDLSAKADAQAKTIADLQAQLAAGAPVTQTQLDALASEAQDIADGLAAAVAPFQPPTPAPTPIGEPPVAPTGTVPVAPIAEPAIDAPVTDATEGAGLSPDVHPTTGLSK
jgi:translation initiation factor 1 (eIF-1/SUI1)